MAMAGSSDRVTLRLGTLCVPLHADEPCGDAAVAITNAHAPDRPLLMMVDGLGHGPEAALAAARAVSFATENATWPLPRLLHALDGALQGSRGAAVGVARIQNDAQGLSLRFAGVGNTRALRWRAGAMQRLPSQYGIVGGGFSAPVAEHTVSLAPGDWVLMFSDGLNERIELPVLLPEWQRDPALLCAHLMKHWRQGADDIGVLACHLACPAIPD